MQAEKSCIIYRVVYIMLCLLQDHHLIRMFLVSWCIHQLLQHLDRTTIMCKHKHVHNAHSVRIYVRTCIACMGAL